MYTQGNRRRQEFYVNRRPIHSRLLSAALEDAYHSRIMLGRFPSCVLHIDLDYRLVDVNVHPAKTEVKFSAEAMVRAVVQRAVSQALDERDSRPAFRTAAPEKKSASLPAAAPPEEQPKPRPKVPKTVEALDFYAELTPKEYRKLAGLPDPPQKADSAGMAAPKSVGVESRDGQTPPKQPRSAPYGFSLRTIAPADRNGEGELHQQKLYFSYTAEKPPESTKTEPAGSAPPVPASKMESATAQDIDLPWRIIGEAFDTYILVEQGEDLLLVDKHAAHERIRYEAFLAADAGSMAQVLLQPVVFTPEASEFELLMGERELLAEIGFEVEDFGGGSLIVRTAPDEIDREEVEATLDEFAEGLAVARRASRTEKREALLRLASCKAALKAGSVSTPAEREALVRRVMTWDDIRYCPHGRPVAAVLPKGEIEKRMGRTV